MGDRGLPPIVKVGLFLVAVFVVVGGLTLVGGGFSFPALFMAMSAVMLMLGLAALWQSLRTALGGGPALVGAGDAALPGRNALLDEKGTLLQAIKDIRFEHQVGKMSDADFQRLERAYRQRAKEVLRLLDQDLGPALQKAEALVAEISASPGYRESSKTGKRQKASSKSSKRSPKRADPKMDCAACGTLNDWDAVHCKECGARMEELDCPSCGTENDPDAKFCKKCATPLAGEAPEKKKRKKKKKRRSARAAAGRGGGVVAAMAEDELATVAQEEVRDASTAGSSEAESARDTVVEPGSAPEPGGASSEGDSRASEEEE